MRRCRGPQAIHSSSERRASYRHRHHRHVTAYKYQPALSRNQNIALLIGNATNQHAAKLLDAAEAGPVAHLRWASVGPR